MIHYLVVMSLSISLPPQSSRGNLNGDHPVVELLDGGHGDRLGRVLPCFYLAPKVSIAKCTTSIKNTAIKLVSCIENRTDTH